MNIIGIHGLIGAGKDTLAKMMMDRLSAQGFECKRIGFADGLKREIAHMLLSYEVEAFDYLSSEDTHKAVEEKVQWINENKENFRLILQGWGTDFRRKLCGQDYWTKKWHQWVCWQEKARFIFTPDVRFANEVEAIRKMKGTLIKLNRNTCIKQSHASEQGDFNGMKFDYEVNNNFELKDLEIQADRLLYKMGYITKQ